MSIVRRLAAFGIVLVLIGLSTAFAASIDVQSEDVATFRTDVSISVPTTTTTTAPTTTTTAPPLPFPGTIYVRGDAAAAMGTLDLRAPIDHDSVSKRLLLLSTETIETQTDATKYVTWQSPTAPPQGYVLSGAVTLYIEQKSGASDRMTAALLSCPATAPASTTVGGGGCTLLTVGIGSTGESGQGFQERTVSFGRVSLTIPVDHQLRLKVVNRQGSTPVLSTSDWDLQWGYLPARQSKLVVAP